jgi:hypothetical protein
MIYSEDNKIKSFNIYSKISKELFSTIYRISSIHYNENCDILVAVAE